MANIKIWDANANLTFNGVDGLVKLLHEKNISNPLTSGSYSFSVSTPSDMTKVYALALPLTFQSPLWSSYEVAAQERAQFFPPTPIPHDTTLSYANGKITVAYSPANFSGGAYNSQSFFGNSVPFNTASRIMVFADA